MVWVDGWHSIFVGKVDDKATIRKILLQVTHDQRVHFNSPTRFPQNFDSGIQTHVRDIPAVSRQARHNGLGFSIFTGARVGPRFFWGYPRLS
jgi:hypothetical protein